MLALIKMQNGQEIIGQVEYADADHTLIDVSEPMQINYRMIASQPMPAVSISRYMPFAAHRVFTISIHDTLHVVEPWQPMVEYYKNALHNYSTQLDKIIEQEMLDAAGVDYDVPNEELYSDMLNRMVLNGTPH